MDQLDKDGDDDVNVDGDGDDVELTSRWWTRSKLRWRGGW